MSRSSFQPRRSRSPGLAPRLPRPSRSASHANSTLAQQARPRQASIKATVSAAPSAGNPETLGADTKNSPLELCELVPVSRASDNLARDDEDSLERSASAAWIRSGLASKRLHLSSSAPRQTLWSAVLTLAVSGSHSIVIREDSPQIQTTSGPSPGTQAQCKSRHSWSSRTRA